MQKRTFIMEMDFALVSSRFSYFLYLVYPREHSYVFIRRAPLAVPILGI